MQVDIEIEALRAEVDSLRAENERLRAALEQLLACPAIADGNHNDPAWACHETAAAETFARKVLARAALAAFSAPKSGWAPTDGQKQLDAARYSGNIAHAPLPPAPGKEEA